jgi:hypothetical protein
MTTLSASVIDWRAQMTTIEPYLKGLGGVVHVRVGNDSPGSAFSRALRSRMREEQWPFQWTSVQVSRDNASTHYALDIVRQIQQKTGYESQPVKEIGELTAGVGTHIKAGGNVDIHGINITLEPGINAPVDSGQEVRQLCAWLGQELETKRIALIFMNSHEYSEQELRALRKAIWDGAFDRLLAQGLVLFDFSDPQRAPDLALWPPEPSAAIDLPDKYDNEARIAATEDLAKIAYEKGVVTSEEQAKGFAQAILMTSANIRDMYSRLALVVVVPRPRNEG